MEVVVIGAGITGLLAARTLHDAGIRVTVMDKGRGVGGRMATRRIDRARVDHGAQFFTARTDAFKSLVEQWLAAGLIAEWSRGWAAPDGTTRDDGHPRYYGVNGMTTVPKYLADGLNLRTTTRVVALNREQERWQVVTDYGTRFRADALIITPPLPQTMALLKSGNLKLTPHDEQQITKLGDYDPTITVLTVLNGNSNLPGPGGMQLDEGVIAWIGDNTMKGISPERRAVTIHASAQFSREHLEDDLTEVGQILADAAQPFLLADIIHFQTHRWRYATPTTTYDAPYYMLDQPEPVVLAGDVFGGPRVEGAALSGLAAAQKILEAT